MHLSLRSFSVECPSPWWQWQCLNNCNNCALIGEGGFVEGLLDSENAGKVFFFQTIIPSLITGAWSLDFSIDLTMFMKKFQHQKS